MRYLFFTFLIIVSCKSESKVNSNLVDLDLMKYGMPLKIKAPADPVVVNEDMGVIQDVTVKGDDNYFLQITSGTATTTDVASLKESLLSDIKTTPFFSKIVEDFDNGFIYEKKISEDRLNYDFRYIKVQGNNEFVFQTGLIGSFSVEDVKMMVESVK